MSCFETGPFQNMTLSTLGLSPRGSGWRRCRHRCGNSPGQKVASPNLAAPILRNQARHSHCTYAIVMSMNLSSLALITALFLIPTAALGQTVARLKLSEGRSPVSELRTADKDQILAARAIAALKRLDKDVLVYRSLGDFEENGKLARVSFEAFRNDLGGVTAEVEPLLSRLPQSRMKTEMRNALDSYRDGAFWWQKIDRPGVVHVSALAFSENTRTSSDTALLATVPYTVAIHWRQAEKYLKRAEGLMNEVQNPGASK